MNHFPVLIVGFGSIGQRHARNLRTLGISDISVVDPSPPSFAVAEKIFPSLDHVSIENYSLVLITSPTIYHVEQALVAQHANCHVFVEKPLATSAQQAAPLIEAKSQRVFMTACNMRFHPSIQHIHRLISTHTLGKPLAYSFHAASWLPHWKPHTDYRQSYSARSHLGGGALLDCIHELDLAQWLFRQPDQVIGMTATGGLPDCDVEDRAVVCMRHGDVVGQLFLSFSTYGYHRRQLIACEFGSIWWDFATGEVRVLEKDGTSIQHGFLLPPLFDFNHVYIEEMKCLLDACQNGKQAPNSLEEAIGTVAIVDAIRASSKR